jgi:hypothetical protein
MALERKHKKRHERIKEDPEVLARYKALIHLVPDHTFAIPFDQLEERGLLNETILKERNAYMASEQKLDPFASSPAKPPKCSLRFEWPDLDKMQIRTFRGLWGAKLLYDYLTEFKAVRWLTQNKLVVNETGMVITSPELEQIVEYELKKDEQQYQWTEPFLSEITAFKNRTTVKSSRGNDRQLPDSEKRKERSPREKKERVSRPSKEGLVSIGDIAQQLEIEPRIARGILRDSKTPKPDAGWAWPKNEVDGIKAIIKKELK